MAKTLWMIEAQCPRCGETYNPENLSNELVQHQCQDEVMGGKPDEVWMVYLLDSGFMGREKRVLRKKFHWNAKSIWAYAATGMLTFGLVWIFFDGVQVGGW